MTTHGSNSSGSGSSDPNRREGSRRQAPQRSSQSGDRSEDAPRKRRRRRRGRGRGPSEGGVPAPSSTRPAEGAIVSSGSSFDPWSEIDDDDREETETVGPHRQSHEDELRASKTYEGGFSKLNLSDVTMRALAAAAYAEPTPIQAGLIPTALAGGDVLGQARTGTGKTAAFVVPVLERLEPRGPHSAPQAIVLVPTRELAVQVKDEFEKLAMGRRTHILAVYGGKPIRQQVERLQRGADVVVGTPGRVLDHIDRGTLKLDGIRIAVLDEADRMLDMGFIPDIEKILRRCPQARQTLLLSATVPPPIEKLSRRFMRDPQTMNFSPTDISADTIDQFYFTVDQDRKFELLLRLIDRENPRQSIIFCRTKRGTERIHGHLQKKMTGTACIHGDLSQSQRDRVMKAFREGKVRHLVATDVVGRGIDVSGISHIINYDIPAFCDDYVHRVGRTGRMGREGVAYSFITPEEGGELTRIEMRIEKLLIRSEIEGFESSKKRGRDDVAAAQAAAARASTKYIQADTGAVAPPSAAEESGTPKSPPKKKYRRAL